MMQPIKIRFTAAFCLETNIYVRVFLGGHLRTPANKAATFYYWSLYSLYINPEIPANSP